MKKFLPTLTLSALLISSLSAQDRDRDPRPTRGKADQPKVEKIDWDRIKERIEGAVERGDMTRDQANQKYTELKKKITDKPQAKRDQPLRAKPENSRPVPGPRRPDALGRVLGELIAQKKINRDDARKIFEAAYASRPQMPTRPVGPNPQERILDELRDTLNQAREELASIREAREDLAEDHEQREHHRHENEERAELRERENAERMERARHEARERAEMMQKRALEQREAQMREQLARETERVKRDLMEKQQMLEKQRRQLEEARRELEKKSKRDTKEED